MEATKRFFTYVEEADDAASKVSRRERIGIRLPLKEAG